MSLKLTVVLLVVALAGQGMAWPRTEPSETENYIDFADKAISTFLGPSQFSLTGGIKNCFDTAVQIASHLKTQTTLFFQARVAKFSLMVRVMKCFFGKDAEATNQCGSSSFSRYQEEAQRIERERISSRQQLSELFKNLPRCYKDAPNLY